VYVHIVNPQQQDRNRREQQIIGLDCVLGIVLLSTEQTIEVEPELRQRHEHVLIESVTYHVAHSNIVVATVLEDERPEEPDDSAQR
jgi:hypothetical protein